MGRKEVGVRPHLPLKTTGKTGNEKKSEEHYGEVETEMMLKIERELALESQKLEERAKQENEKLKKSPRPP